jgi:hypothetical protein
MEDPPEIHEFEVSKISADAAGPLLKFVKQRIASSGQVNSGDTIGEIRFVGRASDASNPTVAWIRVIAQENQTASAAGSYLSFASTAAGTASAAEFMRIFNNRLGIGTQAPETTVHVVSASGIKSEASSDDAVGGKLIAEKSRISGSGAVQSADVIGEVQFSAKDSTGAKSVTADIEASASEGHTASAKGTTLKFLTANTGSATLTEKLSIGDSIESVAAHRLNAVELVAQAVATTATINQLSATKTIVEFTGSTITSVRGINSAQASKVVLLHNRSSADVTLEHENSGAVAADRLSLPNDVFLTLRPRTSIELYYSTTESRWKLKSGSGSGTGSGGGSKNYLGTVNNVNGNGDFEFGATTGWSLGVTGTLTNGLPTGTPTFGSGAAGGLSISTVSSGQLSGAYSLSYDSSGATTAGNMLASNSFTVDSSDQAKVLTIRFSYKAQTNPGNANWSGTSSNSFSFAIWDVTNSSWIVPAGAFGMTQSSGVGIATGTFQTSSNGTQYRLVVYNSAATTGAVTVYFDDFFVGPQTAPIGSVVTDWQSFTPTGSWTTNTSYTGLWRRVGDSMEVKARVSTSGAPTSAAFTLNLPAGYSIDLSKLQSSASPSSAIPLNGEAYGFDNGLGTYPGLLIYNSATSVAIFNHITAAGTNPVITNAGAQWSQIHPFTWGNTDYANINFKVPIAGWSSNVQMSNDTDTRVVSFVGTQSSQAVTANVTNISFTAVKDSHGAWNGSQYVVPVSGDYQISGSFVSSALGVTGVIYINGAAALGGNALFATSYANGAVTGGAVIIPNLVAGNTITLRSNATNTVTTGNLSISRLSGPSAIAATESVRAIYQTAAGQSIPNNSSTTVVFGTRIRDTHDRMNAATGVYTCPASGGYRVSASLYWGTAITAIATDVQIQIFKNGVLYLGNNNPKSGTGSVPITNSGSFPVDCNAGDTIEVRALQNTGSAQTLLTNAVYNWVSIERVGN